MIHQLEVIGFNIESCIIAQASGADRIELCAAPLEGGTTPSYGFIKVAREKLHIQLFPMIRPRGGDFFYTDEEFTVMQHDIKLCKALGCDGVVTGMLNKDGTVDKKRCAALVEMAYPMGVTFHRAFDRAVDPMQALEDIIETGCERILTSGQKPHAADGADLIAQLISKADDRIIIMPGSGIRSGNIESIATKTTAAEFHTSASRIVNSKMNYRQESLEETLTAIIADESEILKMKKILSEI